MYSQLLPNPLGSRLRRLQAWLLSRARFSLPLLDGCGLPRCKIFGYRDHGPLPLPNAVTTVVGRPLPARYVAVPTLADIEALHREYVQALTELYDRWKNIHGKTRRTSMQIIQ